MHGAKRTRTADPLHAMQVLYQLSYGPKKQNQKLNNFFKIRKINTTLLFKFNQSAH